MSHLRLVPPPETPREDISDDGTEVHFGEAPVAISVSFTYANGDAFHANFTRFEELFDMEVHTGPYWAIMKSSNSMSSCFGSSVSN
jgi:hypothetical protein